MLCHTLWNNTHILLLLLYSQLYLIGLTILGDIFVYVIFFFFFFFLSNHRVSHILSSWMVRARCVFVAGIHLSRTWVSGSLESVRWNACEHRLDLGIYSHLKEFLGNWVRTHVNSKGKIPSTGSSEEVWTRNAASRRTASRNTLLTELFQPL